MSKTTQPTITVLDTFSGAGGFSLGFQIQGACIIGGIESDKWASETFLFNHPKATIIAKDIQAGISQMILGRRPSPAVQPHDTVASHLNKSVLPVFCPCEGPASHDNSREVAPLDSRMSAQHGAEQSDSVSSSIE